MQGGTSAGGRESRRARRRLMQGKMGEGGKALLPAFQALSQVRSAKSFTPSGPSAGRGLTVGPLTLVSFRKDGSDPTHARDSDSRHSLSSIGQYHAGT